MSAAYVRIFHMNFCNRSIEKSAKYFLIAVATGICFNVNLLVKFLICTQFQKNANVKCKQKQKSQLLLGWGRPHRLRLKSSVQLKSQRIVAKPLQMDTWLLLTAYRKL